MEKKVKRTVNVLFVILAVCFSLYACSSPASKTKTLTYTNAYDDAQGEEYEIQFDLGYSISGIGSFAEKNGIQITKGPTGKYTYILKHGSKKKEIESVYTDVDLMETCKEFFEISDDLSP